MQLYSAVLRLSDCAFYHDFNHSNEFTCQRVGFVSERPGQVENQKFFQTIFLWSPNIALQLWIVRTQDKCSPNTKVFPIKLGTRGRDYRLRSLKQSDHCLELLRIK